MAYGLSVFKADGSLGFSTADITWQTVAQFTVAANATVTNTYSEIAGMTVIAQRQLVNVPPAAQEDYVPNVTISNNSQTITVAPQSGLSSSQCIIHVLAQDS
jgi:Tfp pilus assembly protein PilW